MKLAIHLPALILAMATMPAFAHHPAADNVDPEIYSMIDDNVADTPHADMTFDDMGRDMEDMEAARESANETREEMAQIRDDISMEVDSAQNEAPEIDTMTLLEDVVLD